MKENVGLLDLPIKSTLIYKVKHANMCAKLLTGKAMARPIGTQH